MRMLGNGVPIENSIAGIQPFVPAAATASRLMTQTQQFQQPAASADLGALGAAAEASRTASRDLSSIFHLKRSDSYFMSDELRSELIRKNLIATSVATQDVVMRKRLAFY